MWTHCRPLLRFPTRYDATVEVPRKRLSVPDRYVKWNAQLVHAKQRLSRAPRLRGALQREILFAEEYCLPGPPAAKTPLSAMCSTRAEQLLTWQYRVTLAAHRSVCLSGEKLIDHLWPSRPLTPPPCWSKNAPCDSPVDSEWNECKKKDTDLWRASARTSS